MDKQLYIIVHHRDCPEPYHELSNLFISFEEAKKQLHRDFLKYIEDVKEEDIKEKVDNDAYCRIIQNDFTVDEWSIHSRGIRDIENIGNLTKEN